MPIRFFYEETNYKLNAPSFYSSWLKEVVRSASKDVGDLNYIFCNDNYLLKINKEYLNHDYFTDILTFDNSEEKHLIAGDVYISIDRVRENADAQSATFENELSRVLIHGLLHLLGYNDSSDEEKKVMREKEDTYISLQKK